MSAVLLLDVVGLTRATLSHMPRLSRLATHGALVDHTTVLPAVTCTVQSTILTGRMPNEHGIVANGWYFRELGEVHLWRQHNRLVHGEKVWETARRLRRAAGDERSYGVANIGWWYAMGATTDVTVTPRPVYHADGRKSPDAYVRPARLHDELTSRFGDFPLFQYWGPTASLTSSRWMTDVTRHIMTRSLADGPPDLTMAYIPHLDYDLQRYGPDSSEAALAARELDGVLAPLIDLAEALGVTVVVLSEYGIAPAHTPVHINRALRAEGLLEVYTQQERELLDPWTSRAFAVADHQVAHVYVTDVADRERVRGILESLPGVDEVLDPEQQARYGIDHPRSGEFVVVAEPGAWFTYYYWLDDDRAPEFARGVDIHRKPGYDPAELFFDPSDPLVKLRAAGNLLKKTVGMRYAMNLVPLDAGVVRGTHGRLPDSAADTPIVIVSDADLVPADTSSIHAVDVHRIILAAQGIENASADLAER